MGQAFAAMRPLLLRLTIGLLIAALPTGGFRPNLLSDSSDSQADAATAALLKADAGSRQFSRIENDGPYAGRDAFQALTAADAMVVGTTPIELRPASFALERPGSFTRPTVHLRL